MFVSPLPGGNTYTLQSSPQWLYCPLTSTLRFSIHFLFSSTIAVYAFPQMFAANISIMSQQHKPTATDRLQNQDLLIRMFDVLPCGVQVMHPIYNKKREIENFEIAFTNQKAKDHLPFPKEGKLFPDMNWTDDDKNFFEKLTRVMENGIKVMSYNERHEKNHGLTYYENISKLEDGVLVIYEDFKLHEKTASPTQLIDSVPPFHSNTISPSKDNGKEETKALLKVIKSENIGLDHLVQSITQALPDILFIMDLNSYEILFANRNVSEILGYSTKLIKRMHNIFLDIMHPADIPYMLDHLEKMKTAADGEVREIEYRLVHADGSMHWYIDRNTVFKRDENGVPCEKIGISHDISNEKATADEIHTLNTKLLSKYRELENVNAELQTFSDIAANDYKETLKNLYTNLEFLIANDAKNLSNSGKANIRKAQNAIQKMKLLTDDIVTFSKIPNIDKEMRAINLSEVLDTAIHDLSERIAASNASITSDKLPVIEGFQLLLSLLFYHILDNAVKFRHKDTPPEIKITYTKAKSSALLPDTMYHKITFRDNGIGFEQNKAAQLFEIFFKLHDKQEYRGSGVGLAVCKKVMDLHNGIILAHALPEKGAEFSCFFPVENN
jgi:PAS domain S-box-containing protein